MNDQKQITDEELGFIDNMIASDFVFDSVISMLKIPQNDKIYKDLVTEMLKRQTKDRIVFSIWNNLSDEQAKNLRQFLNQVSVTESWMKTDDILIEFALKYPEIMEKVYKNLSDFFQKFVEKFNEIAGA